MIELPELLFARLLFVFVHSFHILLLLRKSHLNVTVVTFLKSNSMVFIYRIYDVVDTCVFVHTS